MVALLLYAYTQGIYASRRIAKACEERLDFMALTAMARPDFRTISAFRKRHLAGLAGLFLQVLALCRQAGLVQLGHVALDRTKIKANASKHKAMKAKDGFVQACNAQAAVDAHGQIAVACTLTNNAADQAELGPLLDPIAAGLGGSPKEISADVGYCSEANLETLAARGIRGYVATGRQKHPATGAAQRRGPLVDAMRTRLGRAGRRTRYRRRKQTVEPVIGPIKQARGFRQFLRRGLAKVSAEWALICTAHNLTKLVRVTG